MADKIITVTLNPCLDRTVTVGEFRPYGLNRVLRSRTDPGGKGINVARVLRSFGAEVTATGFVAGGTGRALAESLRKARIDTDFLEIPGETRVNLKVFDERTQKTTEINEPGCAISPENREAFVREFGSLLPRAAVTVLCGSLPPGVPADIYAHLISLAKRAGVRSILDADGEALRRGLEQKPYAIKPNIRELEELTGRKLPTVRDICQAARALIRGGIGVVVVSMGPDGTVAVDAREAYRADAWDIEVKGATGAGDSMVAALAAGLLRDASLAYLARTATAAGTVTASKPGTRLCTREEVRSALPLVTLHQIPE